MIDMSIRPQLPSLMLLCDGDADLGEAICRKFLDLRYRVILAGAQIGNADWVSAIRKYGEVQILQSLDKVTDVAGHAEGNMAGRFVDVLVHVASAGTACETSQAWIKTLAHGMAAHGRGRIIHISADKGGAVVSSEMPDGADTFIGTLTGETAHSQVTVNAITLGCLDTAIASPQSGMPDDRNVCRADSGKLEEIAGLTAYLASDEAAGIHGASIAINMGRYLS